ncbi:hypothetical protein [Microbacterium sp. OR16]|uniref:hypothetical protein n=1 Tax=Microbacterium sp. OR16 TaxID=3095345 RepID=UPI0039B53E17
MGGHRPDSETGEPTRGSRRRRDVGSDASDASDGSVGSVRHSDADELDERTVVIDRDSADERTVVIDRSGAGASTADASIADTIVVRSRDAAAEAESSIADTVVAPPRRSGSEATPAIYKPRPAPIVPSRPPTVTAGAAPTRDTAVVKTSVVRRDRRAGVVVVASVAVACLISVVGLVTLGVALLG